jgi:ABC-type phosphate/phosphonate transport system permease subunit
VLLAAVAVAVLVILILALAAQAVAVAVAVTLALVVAEQLTPEVAVVVDMAVQLLETQDKAVQALSFCVIQQLEQLQSELV